MTLDSYLRDLLGGGTGSGLKVNIVDDNVSTTTAESSNVRRQKRKISRACSWYGNTMGNSMSSKSNNKNHSSTRWNTTMSRRKSDSVLGKPQRRTSIEDAMEVCQNARMLVEELTVEEAGEDENSSDFFITTPSDDAATTTEAGTAATSTTNTTTSGTPSGSNKSRPPRSNLVKVKRAFSESSGKKTSASEQIAIENTMMALHHYRSTSTTSGVLDRRRMTELLDKMGSSAPPPQLPIRRGSTDQILVTTATALALTSSPGTIGSTTALQQQRSQHQHQPSPKNVTDSAAPLRPKSIDFPESLRELPYQSTAAESSLS